MPSSHTNPTKFGDLKMNTLELFRINNFDLFETSLLALQPVNHKQTTINDTVYKVDTVEEMGNMTWPHTKIDISLGC